MGYINELLDKNLMKERKNKLLDETTLIAVTNTLYTIASIELRDENKAKQCVIEYIISQKNLHKSESILQEFDCTKYIANKSVIGNIVAIDKCFSVESNKRYVPFIIVLSLCKCIDTYVTKSFLQWFLQKGHSVVDNFISVAIKEGWINKIKPDTYELLESVGEAIELSFEDIYDSLFTKTNYAIRALEIRHCTYEKETYVNSKKNAENIWGSDFKRAKRLMVINSMDYSDMMVAKKKRSLSGDVSVVVNVEKDERNQIMCHNGFIKNKANSESLTFDNGIEINHGFTDYFKSGYIECLCECEDDKRLYLRRVLSYDGVDDKTESAIEYINLSYESKVKYDAYTIFLLVDSKIVPDKLVQKGFELLLKKKIYDADTEFLKAIGVESNYELYALISKLYKHRLKGHTFFEVTEDELKLVDDKYLVRYMHGVMFKEDFDREKHVAELIITLIKEERLQVMTGRAGTGKTTEISTRIRLNAIEKEKSVAITLTNKAQNVLENKIYSNFNELKAHYSKVSKNQMTIKTIHSYLKHCVTKNTPIDANYIVIDEASMIDLETFECVLEAIVGPKDNKNTEVIEKVKPKVLIAGDLRQLKCVGMGDVFADIIKFVKEYSPIYDGQHYGKYWSKPNEWYKLFYELKHVHRHEVMGVIEDILAMRWDDKTEIIPDEQLDDVIDALCTQSKETVLITYKNETVNTINKLVCEKLGFTEEFPVGSRVYVSDTNYYSDNDEDVDCTKKNEYKKGFMGIVKKIDADFRIVESAEKSYRIPVEALEYGYAITAHKAQGSGFESVYVYFDEQDAELVTNECLYTAATRYRNELYFIGTKNTYKKISQKREVRNTALYMMLLDVCHSINYVA